MVAWLLCHCCNHTPSANGHWRVFHKPDLLSENLPPRLTKNSNPGGIALTLHNKPFLFRFVKHFELSPRHCTNFADSKTSSGMLESENEFRIKGPSDLGQVDGSYRRNGLQGRRWWCASIYTWDNLEAVSDKERRLVIINKKCEKRWIA